MINFLMGKNFSERKKKYFWEGKPRAAEISEDKTLGKASRQLSGLL